MNNNYIFHSKLSGIKVPVFLEKKNPEKQLYRPDKNHYHFCK